MKTTHQLLAVSEGKTMVYLIPGVLIIFLALPFIYFFFPVALALTVIAIVLFLVETGLEFDPEAQRFRRYKRLFASSWGQWHTMTEPVAFHLRLSVESRSFYALPYQPSPTWNGGRASSKSVTYDLSYVNSLDQHFMIYEFQDYDLAKQMVKSIQALNSFEVTNHIALKLQENREKRMNRR